MADDDFAQFRERLDDTHEWPAVFLFKFVMPRDLLEEFAALLDIHPYETRESRKGNYISYTAEKLVCSSEEVVQIYRRAARFKGVVSL